MQNYVDAGAAFDNAVSRLVRGKSPVPGLLEKDLSKLKAQFCDCDFFSICQPLTLEEIALRWLSNGCSENLSLIHCCMTNTYIIDADMILNDVKRGEICEDTARYIAKAERLLIEFIDRDYEEHLEEYEGFMPIWGDDWEYITNLLLHVAQQGMTGEDVFAAIKEWVDYGAYHRCYIEDVLEGVPNQVLLENTLNVAHQKAHQEVIACLSSIDAPILE